MERWQDESDEDYAARQYTARRVAAARERYERSDAFADNRQRMANYEPQVGNMDIDIDDEESLQAQLQALGAGISSNTATLREGLGMDTTPEARAWAQSKLAEADPYAAKELALREGMAQQTRDTTARLRAARAKLAARTPSKTDFWLAMAQGAARPNEGGKLGWTGNVAEAIRPALARQEQFVMDQQAGLDAYDQDIEAALRGESDIDLRLLQERRKAWDDERLQAAKILGKNVPGGVGGADTAGGKKFSQETATQNIDWATKNGPVFDRSMIELQHAMDMIKQAKAEGKRVSGRDVWSSYLSLFGDFGEKLESVANPLASDIRNTVLNTVQQTLRPTLGAQFTEREGARVLARAYDPLKPEEVNIARIQALLTQIQKQAAGSRSLMQWFTDNDGDMTGYVMPEHEAAALEVSLYQAMDDAERSLGLDAPRDLPPGTIVLPPARGSAAKKAPVAPEKVEPIGRDTSKKEERSFWDRVKPFAEGGSVNNDQTSDGRVPVQLPDGEVVYFAPGTTREQIDEWYADIMAKEQRKEALLNLGASGAAGISGGALGYGMHRLLEGAAERAPGSPIRIRPGERRTVDFWNAQGLDMKDAGAELAALRRRVPSAVALDVMPQEARGLVNEAMRSGTPATAELQSELAGRNKDARSTRIPDAINAATQADPYLDQRDKLMKARSDAADPLYQGLRTNPTVKESAFERVPAKDFDQNFIDWLSSTPVGKEAISRANMKWGVDKQNAGKSPISTSATGMPTGYDIRYLDNVKQALDDLEADATGKGYSARDVAAIRRRLLEQVDAARPDYAEARGAFQEGSRPLTALSIGRGGDDVKDLSYQDSSGRMQRAKGYLEMTPEEAQRYVGGLTHYDQRENLRSGIAETLNREIRGTAAKSNPAAAILENPDRMALLEIALEPKDFKRLVKTLEDEARVWDTSAEFGRKTSSARGKARGAPVSTAANVKEGAKGAPGKFLRAINPVSWAYRATVPGEKANPKKAERTFKQDEADDAVRVSMIKRRQDLERLSRAANRRGSRGRRAGRAGIITGLGAAGATGYKNLKDEDESEE